MGHTPPLRYVSTVLHTQGWQWHTINRPGAHSSFHQQLMIDTNVPIFLFQLSLPSNAAFERWLAGDRERGATWNLPWGSPEGLTEWAHGWLPAHHHPSLTSRSPHMPDVRNHNLNRKLMFTGLFISAETTCHCFCARPLSQPSHPHIKHWGHAYWTEKKTVLQSGSVTYSRTNCKK